MYMKGLVLDMGTDMYNKQLTMQWYKDVCVAQTDLCTAWMQLIAPCQLLSILCVIASH